MTNQEQYDNMIIGDILNCAKFISNYCNKIDCCTDCQFMRKTNGIGCIFNNVTPDNWEGFIDENLHS